MTDDGFETRSGTDHRVETGTLGELWPAGRPPLELSIVLPAHNEEELLAETVDNLTSGLRARGASFELILVENGSSDRTSEIAAALGDRYPELFIVHRDKADYGEALATGLERASGEYVVLFDVDYFDLGFLDRALEILGAHRAEIVVGSKRAIGSEDRRPLTRRLLTAGFTLVLRAGFALPVSDAHGIKALRRCSVAQIAAQCRLRESLFDVELVVRADRAGLAVAELPVAVAERRAPRTSVLRRTVATTLGLLRLRKILAQPNGAPARVGL